MNPQEPASETLESDKLLEQFAYDFKEYANGRIYADDFQARVIHFFSAIKRQELALTASKQREAEFIGLLRRCVRALSPSPLRYDIERALAKSDAAILRI